MAKSFGEPLKKLRAVPIKENGEKLVDPCELSGRIKQVEHPIKPEIKRSVLLRETVARKLAEAAEKLPIGIDLVIFEGFRPLDIQRQQNEWVRDLMLNKHPNWNKATLQRKINEFSAPADDKCPPPHLTGAAVDLYLVDKKTGKMLDMTSPYKAWGTEGAETNATVLSEKARNNRRLLSETLESVGLTNYIGEWWHWSYGDSGWALRTGQTHAIYDRITQ